MQPIGIAVFILPVASAHGGNALEDDRGSLMGSSLRGGEACGWGVGVVDKGGGIHSQHQIGL